MTRGRVLRLATPIIGENFLQAMVGVIDTLMIARIGAAALAGVGVALEVVFFMIAILASISIGGTILISQAIGRRDQEGANRLARQTVLWGVLLSIPVGLIGFAFSGALIDLFHTEDDVAEHATTYLQITGATIFTLLMTFVCGAVLRGAGDGRSPLFASIVANAVKVALSWMLIFGNLGFPRLEVTGSAISSSVARGVGMLILVWLLASGRRAVTIRGTGGWRPHLSFANRLFRLGVPAAIEQMLMSAGFTMMISIVAIIGTPALAAQQISFNALSLAILPGFGFAIAATALVGQSIGATRPDHARDAARIATTWAVGWMAIAAIVYLVLSESVVGIYTDDAAVVDQASSALVAIGLSLPLWAFWSVNGGALRGSGDTRTPMILSATAMWSAVLVGWIAVRWWDADLWVVWAIFLVTGLLPAIGNRRLFNRRIDSVERDQAGAPAAV